MSAFINKKETGVRQIRKAEQTVISARASDDVIVKKAMKAAEVFKKYPLPVK